MPLSGQEQAAWAGVLSSRRGGKTLPNAVQTALVAFFSENELATAEYWPVDPNQCSDLTMDSPWLLSPQSYAQLLISTLRQREV